MNWMRLLAEKETTGIWEMDPFDGESISHHVQQPRPSLAEEAEAARKMLAEIRKKMPVQTGIFG